MAYVQIDVQSLDTEGMKLGQSSDGGPNCGSKEEDMEQNGGEVSGEKKLRK